MKNFLMIFAALAALAVHSNCSHADLVTSSIVFNTGQVIDPTMTFNLGGLGTGGTATISNTEAASLLSFTTSPSANGSVFQGFIDITGIQENGAAGIRTAGSGLILVNGGGSNNSTLNFSIPSAPVQIAGAVPSTATFTQFLNVTVNQFNNTADDGFTFGTTSIDGAGPPAGTNAPATFDVAGTTIDTPFVGDGTDRFRLQQITFELDVQEVAVPEPGTAGLLTMSLLGLLVRRRRS